MNKIGIFGGTFNPIHNGHLNLAEKVSDYLNLDKVLIVPASVPPHKEWLKITDSKHRYEMCRLACQENPLYEVSDIEIKRIGRSYTIDTINEISVTYENSKLFFIMGSDSFLSVMKWLKFKDIARLTTICTAARNEEEYKVLHEAQKLMRAEDTDTIVCDIPTVTISSTEIRNNIIKGNNIENMVPASVAEYIKRNNLYKQNWSDFNAR